MKKTFIKIAALAVAVTMICISLCACGGKKDFTVGFDADNQTYDYIDTNGEYTGFDIELAREVVISYCW